MTPTTERVPLPSRAPGVQFFAIQYLRAVAALMVAYYHLGIQVPSYAPYFAGPLLGNGNLAAGVDVFFVISGFIMLVSNRSSSPRRFIVRRLVRIVPLYWLLTLGVAVGVWLRPDLFRTTVVDATFLVKSLLFIPYANPGHGGDLMPVLVPGWSLNFEMFFYGAFALTLLLPSSRRVVAAGLAFALILAAGRLMPEGVLPRELLFYADPRIVEFWLGMVIAQWLLRQRLDAIPAGWGVLLALAGFDVVLTGTLLPLPAASLLGETLESILPAAAIVLGMVVIERRGHMPEWPWLHKLGDASYSLYLSHIFSLGLSRTIWIKLGLAQADLPHALAFAVFSMALVVAGALLCYRWIEQPLLRRLQSWLKGDRPTAAVRGVLVGKDQI